MTIQTTDDGTAIGWAGTAIVPSDSDTVIAGLRADNAGMVDELAALRNEVASLRMQVAGARRDHESDIRIIGETLIDEAERQDWCDRFDDAVSDVNTRLVVPLPEREREYEATITGYLRVPFTHRVTVFVRGSEDAEDTAREAAEQAMQDVSAFDLDTDTYGAEIESWEVEEVDRA